MGGFEGDPRGIRLGSKGDPRPFWGIRDKNAWFPLGFWGDPRPTTYPFYNIKLGNGLFRSEWEVWGKENGWEEPGGTKNGTLFLLLEFS